MLLTVIRLIGYNFFIKSVGIFNYIYFIGFEYRFLNLAYIKSKKI